MQHQVIDNLLNFKMLSLTLTQKCKKKKHFYDKGLTETGLFSRIT
jgi:hypothetical protein